MPCSVRTLGLLPAETIAAQGRASIVELFIAARERFEIRPAIFLGPRMQCGAGNAWRDRRGRGGRPVQRGRRRALGRGQIRVFVCAGVAHSPCGRDRSQNDQHGERSVFHTRPPREWTDWACILCRDLAYFQAPASRRAASRARPRHLSSGCPIQEIEGDYFAKQTLSGRFESVLSSISGGIRQN